MVTVGCASTVPVGIRWTIMVAVAGCRSCWSDLEPGDMVAVPFPGRARLVLYLGTTQGGVHLARVLTRGHGWDHAVTSSRYGAGVISIGGYAFDVGDVFRLSDAVG